MSRMAALSPLESGLVGFTRELSRHGIGQSPDQVVRYLRGLATFAHLDVLELYWAGRVCLGVPPRLIATYDEVFYSYYLSNRLPTRMSSVAIEAAGHDGATEPDSSTATRDGVVAGDAADEQAAELSTELAGATASLIERLKVTPFSECTPAELEHIREFVRALRFQPARLVSRRFEGTRRAGRLDLRATTRGALPTGGDLLQPRWRQRRLRPERIVVLLDVSRSMAPYSRMLLHFAFAACASGRDVEVVCFGTRVTRITAMFRRNRTPKALERAAHTILDWNGGTRISDALNAVTRMRSVGSRLRSATVVICSDGLEQGDTSDLRNAMRRLRHACQRVIWVNPLAGDPRYEPIARGMQAALPFTDHLLAGDTVNALRQVADLLAERCSGRRVTAERPVVA